MTRARFELFAINGHGVAWRFVASNDYVTAVGVDAMPDVATARETLAALPSMLPDATWAWYADPGGRLRWDLRSSGAPLATSSRWYHSRVACESTLEQFLHDAPTAPVIDTGKRLRKVSDLCATAAERPLVAQILTSGRRRFGRAR